MRILLAAAEAYPFAKVGGLADVAGSLPQALAARGHEVRVVLPAYRCVARGELDGSVQVRMNGDVVQVGVERRLWRHGIELQTLTSDPHFGRPAIYGYRDDDERFVLFSKAVTALAASREWIPDVIHVNDWHTALVAQQARRGPERHALTSTATVLTIHNLHYQGPVSPSVAAVIGFGDAARASLLARGVGYADAINTVSRRYREEILTPEGGMGMDRLLRARRDSLVGILNGVDYESFDPASDPQLASRFSSSSLDRRTANKAALQRRARLATGDAPLVATVARLVGQKGIDLVCASIPAMVALGVQVLVMGSGEPRYHRALRAAVARHPGWVAYDEDSGDGRTRLVYAGCDLFLAPSTFEPCGLSPLIALRYGAIPVVRSTGGLADTIVDYTRTPATGLGFTFRARSAVSLVHALRRGLSVHRDRPAWEALQRRAMETRFSWDDAVTEYERLYERALDRAVRRPAGAAILGQAVREAIG